MRFFLFLFLGARLFGQSQLDLLTQIKNKPFLDVRESGAKCDGTTNDATAIQSAITSAISSKKILLIPAGTCKVGSTLTVSGSLYVSGLGTNTSVISATGALSGSLFNVTGTGEGYSFQDFSVNMTSAGTIDVFNLQAQTVRPWFSRLEITYPSGGTGKAFYFAGPGEVHLQNTVITRAGYCVDIQGDNTGGPGTEDFFDNIICDSPGSWGFRISRTTATDVGGYYLKGYKITNPDNRTTSGGFLLTSTQTNTANILFCTQCIADNVKGNPALDINNQAAQHFNTSWFTSGVTTYSLGHSAIRIRGTTTEVNFLDVQAQGHADALYMQDSPTSVRWVGGKLSGVDAGCTASTSCAIQINPSATLNNMDIRATLIDEVPMSNASQTKLITQSGAQPLTYAGSKIYTLNNAGLAQLFCLQDATSGADPTGIKCLGVNNLGWLDIRNSTNGTILALTDTGIMALPLADHQIVTGTSPNTTTLNFAVPSGAVGLEFPNTNDTMVGRATIDTLTNKTLTQPKLSTLTPASAGATGAAGTIVWDSGFVYICIGSNTWKRAALSTW